jgi:Zn-dependent protease
MSLSHVNIVFEIIAFMFAISIHESAHAWTAWRLGDPTARMLGRVSLNPIAHIDPVGTILLPALALFFHFPMIGWAKPTPVDPRNFRNPMRDDILTSVAGPVSNLIVAVASIILLRIVLMFSPQMTGVAEPLVDLLALSMEINILLMVFNLIPVPPLDGSHVVRHLLPEGARRVYDTLGMVGLIFLFMAGGRFIGAMSGVIQTFLVNTFLRGF